MDFARGANSAPQTSWLDFRERQVGGKEGKKKGGKERAKGEARERK